MMGFFSKLTADTKQSIPSIYAMAGKPVYLLQPNGRAPIKEEAYEGYGVIGGVDWFIWLAKENAKHLRIEPNKLGEEELRDIGISLDCGSIMLNTKTGQYWSIFRDHRLAAKQPSARFFQGTFSETIPELGKSANELVAAGIFKKIPIKDINDAPYSIKLSHNENARYEDLRASEDCPHQGYFYPSLMDEIEKKMTMLQSYGFKVSRTESGWTISDPLDDEDGYRVEAFTKIEAVTEGHKRLEDQ